MRHAKVKDRKEIFVRSAKEKDRKEIIVRRVKEKDRKVIIVRSEKKTEKKSGNLIKQGKVIGEMSDIFSIRKKTLIIK